MSLFPDLSEPRSDEPAPAPEAANGKWVVLVDDEPFDRAHNLIIEIRGEQVIAGDTRGTARAVAGKLQLDMVYPGDAQSDPTYVRYALELPSVESGSITGMIYTGDAPIPDGDISAMHRALEDELGDEVDEDPRYDALPISDAVRLFRDDFADAWFGEPSKYSTVDVTMYSYEKQVAAGIVGVSTDEEIEAALRQLPLARVVLATGEEFSAAELIGEDPTIH